MIDRRRELITQIALSMLEQWYSTWDSFKDHHAGEVRRMALHSKARGLCYHDRALIKAETAFDD